MASKRPSTDNEQKAKAPKTAEVPIEDVQAVTELAATIFPTWESILEFAGQPINQVLGTGRVHLYHVLRFMIGARASGASLFHSEVIKLF